MDASLRALIYADIFSFPLKKNELWQRQISPPKVGFNRWKKDVEKLVRQKKISKLGGYYFLPGRKRIVQQRIKGEEEFKKKFLLSQKAVSILGKIPTIWFVGLTGNLAAGVARAGDDIDLMIISAPNTLWLTRLLVYLLLQISRIPTRHPRDKKVTNKLCLNLFLDSKNLALAKEFHNLFIAHEIVLLKKLYNKNQTYERFLFANRWVKKFLPYGYKLKNKLKKVPFSKIKQNLLLKTINYFCFVCQKMKMIGEPKAKKISLTQAFFHPQDISLRVINLFQAQTRSLRT